MKILHVTMSPIDSTYGGLEIYLQQLVAQQIKQGHTISVLSIYWKGDNLKTVYQKLSENLKTIEITLPEKLRDKDRSLIVDDLKKELLKLIHIEQPDICHGHHGFAHEVTTLCKANGIPCLYTCHCGEPFCSKGTLICNDGEIRDGKTSLKKCMNYYKTLHFINPDGSLNNTPQPIILSKLA